MRFIKQSTSVDLPIGPFVDSTDGFTAKTALTLTQPDIRLKKNGAAWAQKAAAQTLSHEENGWYEVTLDATDTDTLGQLMLAVNETGALPVFCEFTVLAANVYDSLIGGGDVLDVSTIQFNGTAVTAAAGRPEVNATHFAGTAYATAVTAWIASLFATVVEGTITFVQSMRLANAANGGQTSGMGTTTGLLKNQDGTKTRVTATQDADGNRSAITFTDLT